MKLIISSCAQRERVSVPVHRVRGSEGETHVDLLARVAARCLVGDAVVHSLRVRRRFHHPESQGEANQHGDHEIRRDARVASGVVSFGDGRLESVTEVVVARAGQ